MAQRGRRVHLLTCNNGVSIGTDLSEYRFNELKSRFSDGIVSRVIVSTAGLFRRVALAELEQDFALYSKSLFDY